ncbi:M12 family metallopeptidase [Pseudomonas sp. UFMG81]|uniref:M12 family metallopeptidase n=1 Tax=Pseudomonas sp. UFMG81 TaxID=2745936 RepID=UPI00188F1EB9|nr:M12 family metallopeptidase [Pseudomonas sp. UFMG81]
MHPLVLPRRITPSNLQLARELAIAENPRNAGGGIANGHRQKRSHGTVGKLWQPGRTLWVSFLGTPDRRLKTGIFDLACQWLDLSDANLYLDLTHDNDPTAQIRVRTGRSLARNESYVGTDALTATAETMNLNVQPGDASFEHVVLHEFGHALGAEHEHQHPDAAIPWNMIEVLKQVSESLGWSYQEIMEEMIGTRDDVGLVKTAYDPTSVMHYAVPQAFTHGDWEVGLNSTLSEKDLAFMRLAYPLDA